MLEPERDAEAVAQRRRQQTGAGGGADQRERREVEAQRAGARPLADDDVDRAVLHRRVEDLLDRPRQPVDLVDEEDVARLERRQDRRQVALPLQRRPRDGVDARAHLDRDDVRQAGLAEARRPGQQHVVGRLAALARGRHEQRELVDDVALADEVLQPARPQRPLELVLGRRARRR